MFSPAQSSDTVHGAARTPKYAEADGSWVLDIKSIGPRKARPPFADSPSATDSEGRSGFAAALSSLYDPDDITRSLDIRIVGGQWANKLQSRSFTGELSYIHRDKEMHVWRVSGKASLTAWTERSWPMWAKLADGSEDFTAPSPLQALYSAAFRDSQYLTRPGSVRLGTGRIGATHLDHGTLTVLPRSSKKPSCFQKLKREIISGVIGTLRVRNALVKGRLNRTEVVRIVDDVNDFLHKGPGKWRMQHSLTLDLSDAPWPFDDDEGSDIEIMADASTEEEDESIRDSSPEEDDPSADEQAIDPSHHGGEASTTASARSARRRFELDFWHPSWSFEALDEGRAANSVEHTMAEHYPELAEAEDLVQRRHYLTVTFPSHPIRGTVKLVEPGETLKRYKIMAGTGTLTVSTNVAKERLRSGDIAGMKDQLKKAATSAYRDALMSSQLQRRNPFTCESTALPTPSPDGRIGHMTLDLNLGKCHTYDDPKCGEWTVRHTLNLEIKRARKIIVD